MDMSIAAFRAGVGGYVGGGQVHPALLDAAREGLAEAKDGGLVSDGFVARCGADIDVVLMQTQAQRSQPAREIATELLSRAASAGARLRQHGCNGGIHLDGAELVFVPRPSEPVVCFFSNRADPGAWNLVLYRMFADPFTTPALVSDAAMTDGFRFVADADWVQDVFDLPADLYRFLAALGAGACVREVRSTSGEIAAVVSTRNDPVLIARGESPFPGVEDALEAFTAPFVPGIAGDCALVPVSANSDGSTRALPRAMGLGFQVTPDRLVGPRDLLGDASFDDARRQAVSLARSMRPRFVAGCAPSSGALSP